MASDEYSQEGLSGIERDDEAARGAVICPFSLWSLFHGCTETSTLIKLNPIFEVTHKICDKILNMSLFCAKY